MASFHTTRTKSGRGPLGCLIPLIMATLLLAAGVTFISWFALDDGELEPPLPATISTPGAPDERVERTPSIDAIVEVIQSEGFVEYGIPESIDLGSQRQATHKFRRDDMQIRATIYTFKRVEQAQKKQAETPNQASATLMGNRLVLLQTDSNQGRELLAPIAAKLKTFQSLLDDK